MVYTSTLTYLVVLILTSSTVYGAGSSSDGSKENDFFY